MTDKIVIEGTEFPANGEKNGRTFTRALQPDTAERITGLREWFHDRYKGPFTPVTYEQRAPIPPCFGSERIETTKGKRNLASVFDDIVDVDAAVVDSQGNLVVGPIARGDAWFIALALNTQPHGILDGSALGISPFHGVCKYAAADRCSFWCIQVPTLSYANGVEKKSHSYVAPFYNRYELPRTTNSPMSALRFSSTHSAKKVIDLIKNEFLSNEEVKKEVENRLTRWTKSVEGSKILSGKRPCSLDEWEAMRPVIVKYTYMVAE